MPIPLLVPLAISGVGMAAKAWKTGQAKDAMEAQASQARNDAARWESELARLKDNRPNVSNPYANMQNSFANMSNPYAKLSNQYANLGVATQAAEYQAEQADIALANTLDTMAMTGAGAGGATALAQAALQSKKGIAADIQRQEAQNQKLAAQGAMEVQSKKAEGQMQVDTLKAQGEQTVQQLQGQGKQFVMETMEERSKMDMDNASNMMMNYKQMEMDAMAGQMQADLSLANQFGSMGSTMASSLMPYVKPV